MFDLLPGSMAHEDSILTGIAVARPPLRLRLQSSKTVAVLLLGGRLEVGLLLGQLLVAVEAGRAAKQTLVFGRSRNHSHTVSRDSGASSTELADGKTSSES